MSRMGPAYRRRVVSTAARAVARLRARALLCPRKELLRGAGCAVDIACLRV